jgi:hypothetical protein
MFMYGALVNAGRPLPASHLVVAHLLIAARQREAGGWQVLVHRNRICPMTSSDAGNLCSILFQCQHHRDEPISEHTV